MEERLPAQPAGFILSKIGLLILFCCMLFAAWNGQIVITVILGLVMASAGFSKLFSRISLVNVSCHQILSEKRVFPGDRIELKLQLSNRKLLPLPWVQVDHQLPLGFAPDLLIFQENRPGYGFLRRTSALLWYSKITWKAELQCLKRGYFKVGPSKITSGDIFGFYPRSIDEPIPEYVIVYPKMISVDPAKIPFLYPIGDSRALKRLFDDPTRIMGVRDYSPHDSLRRIHWKATARRQSLQVKVFEPTTTLDVALFLEVDGFAENGKPDDFELAISTTATIARHILDAGNAAGLFVNTRLADSGQIARILPGSSPHQLVSMLEALAKTTRISHTPFQDFINNERKSLPWGTTLIFIIYEVSATMNSILENLKDSGYKVLVRQIKAKKSADASENAPTVITTESY
jgi:uncharacterized protein (DUF58 family)